MSKENEILDDNLNENSVKSDYDLTNEFDEGYSQPRITFKSLVAFVLSVLNLEKGILFTIKELIIRPKQVLEEYLKRDRKKLVNPIRFLVFSTAISTFFMFSIMNIPSINEQTSKDWETGFNQGFIEELKKDSIMVNNVIIDSIAYQKAMVKNNIQKKATSSVMQKMLKMNDNMTFALVFFFALFSLIFFKNMGYNYTEHLVINSFTISMMNVITILFMIPTYLTLNLSWTIVGSILSLIYILYMWMCVYDRKSIGGFFRCLLNYLVSYLTFVLIFGTIVGLYLFVSSDIN